MADHTKKIIRDIKGLIYDDLSNLVRNVTSNDAVVPAQEQVFQVVQSSDRSNNFATISSILWRRLNDHKNPRHVLKSLSLLDALLRLSSNKDMFAQMTKDRIHEVEELTRYISKDEGDLGRQIRAKAEEVLESLRKHDTKKAESEPQPEPEPEPEPEHKPKKKVVKKKKQPIHVDADPAPGHLSASVSKLGMDEEEIDEFDRAFSHFQGPNDAIPEDWKNNSNQSSIDDIFGAPPPAATQQSRRPASPPMVIERTPSPSERKAPLASPIKSLLGDLGEGFSHLSERKGGEAAPFKHIDDAIALPTMIENVQLTASPPQVPRREPVGETVSPMHMQHSDESLAPPIVVTRPVKRPVSVPAAFLPEAAAYAIYINKHLGNDPSLRGRVPLDPSGRDFFERIRDGVVLAKLINFVQPDTIDDRVINMNPQTPEQLQENSNLVLGAVKSLGVKTELSDLSDEKKRMQLMNIVSQLIRMKLLSAVNTKDHPELLQIAKHQSESNNVEQQIADFVKLPPEAMLLKWINFHMDQAHRHKDVVQLKDSECYGVLMHAIVDAMPPEHFPPDPILVENLLQEHDLGVRAKIIVDHAQELSADFVVQPADIVSGHPRLNLAFAASLFNIGTGLKMEDVREEEKKHLQNIEKAGLMTDDVGDNREERAFRMWMNSLGIDDVYLHNLFSGELADGLMLLRLIDHIDPGRVEWNKVTKVANNRFKRVSNCNYVVELGKAMGFSVVNIAGLDIVDGNKKIILAFCWQLMRYHILKFMNQVREKAGSSKGAPISDQHILQWANLKVAKAYESKRRPGPPLSINGFNDKSLANCRFLIDLLWAAEPHIIDWGLVVPGANAQEKLLNARYAISVARKLGAVVFMLPEDLVEVRPKMILTFLAAIMALE